MKIENILNLDNLNKMIDAGYISARKHPVLDLVIYNYTHACQYDNVWNNETLNCRGLIVHKNGDVIARPFPKFFNMEQVQDQIPNESFEAFEKLDGSLGVMYLDHDGQFSLATRGSFESEQAIEGTKILREKYGEWLRDRYEMTENRTFLFEIIYPENRIVVDYKGLRDVVMLTIIDNKTGKDTFLNIKYPWKVAKRYDGVKDLKHIKSLNSENEEGFVILFESGFRCKVKFDEYMRLHRVLTGINEKDIWESLSLGKDPVAEYADKVPDEFYEWMKKTKEKLVLQFEEIRFQVVKYRMDILAIDFKSRKDLALWIQANVPENYRGMVFNFVDGKEYQSKIWGLFRPVGPFHSFKVDEE